MFNNTGYSLSDIAAATGNRNNDGFGFGDGNGAWFLILFIILIMCGWNGNNGWGNGGNGAGNTAFVANDLQRGFDQAAITTDLNGISTGLCNGFSNVQQSLCNGFAGVTAGFANTNANIANGFAQNEIANNARQMADMQQNFALQTAMQAGFTGTNVGIENLKYIAATENCADRTQAAENTRDIIDAVRSGNQIIMDKICALELQGVQNQLDDARRDNIALQNQLNMATLRESQTAQNAFIQAGLTSEVDALYNRLNNCPVPSVPVYGRQPIFTCGGQDGTGCGCSNNGFYN